MNTLLNPYIHFKDNAREAMEFYKTVFGGKLEMTTFKDGMSTGDATEDTLIMHAMLKADNGLTFMAADSPKHMGEYKPGSNIGMSLSGDNEEELTNYFNKLSEGGNIAVPLNKAPWGDTFGMFTDKFGIEWMVNISGKKE